jgi:hypothetical protein
MALDYAKRLIDERKSVFFVDQDRPHVFPHLACVPVDGGDFVFDSVRLAHTGNAIPRGFDTKAFQAVVYSLRRATGPHVDVPESGLTWEFEPDWFHVGIGFQREDSKEIRIVEAPGGERTSPPSDAEEGEFTWDYAWITGWRSAMWIPYSDLVSCVVEIRLSGLGMRYGVAVRVGGWQVLTLQPQDEYRTVNLRIPPELPPPENEGDVYVTFVVDGCMLLEFVSLAPEDYTGPQGVWIDYIRLRPVEADDPEE